MRAAALEYFKTAEPHATVRGVNLISYTGNLYIATLGTEKDGHDRIVPIIVRMFIRENGDTYWRAEQFTNQPIPDASRHQVGALKSKVDELEANTEKE